MADRVDPPAPDWDGCVAAAPGLAAELDELHQNSFGGSPRNLADLATDLLIAAGDFGRAIYQYSWPPGPIERAPLQLVADRMTVTAGETLMAIARFREGDRDIRVAPSGWAPNLDVLAQPPDSHFY